MYGVFSLTARVGADGNGPAGDESYARGCLSLLPAIPDPNSVAGSIFFIVVGIALIWHGASRIRGGERVWQPYWNRPRRARPWFGRPIPPLIQILIGSLGILSSVLLLAR